MVPQTVASRVDTLERKMGRLEELPNRMTALESQIVNSARRSALNFLQSAARWSH